MPSLHSVHQASSRPELHSPSDNVSSNPVGQLEELFMKELHNLPVYAEHVSGVGKYVEYECVVSGKGLSAKGWHLIVGRHVLAITIITITT